MYGFITQGNVAILVKSLKVALQRVIGRYSTIDHKN